VSHGCIRLYPEDIEQLFPLVPLKTPGQFIYQPVKVGMREGRVFIEVHKDIYSKLPALHRESWRLIDKLGVRHRVDPERVKQAVLEQSGVVREISRESFDAPEQSLHRAAQPRRPEQLVD
jgi:L,D-transpeptidase ErfK/SrfK